MHSGRSPFVEERKNLCKSSEKSEEASKQASSYLSANDYVLKQALN